MGNPSELGVRLVVGNHEVCEWVGDAGGYGKEGGGVELGWNVGEGNEAVELRVCV